MILTSIFENYTLLIVILGTTLIGLSSGIVGVFLTLKKESLIGDAISHATLPGVVLAFIFTNQADLFISIIGAIVAAIFATLLMELIKINTKIKSDAALAIILSSTFGFGQVLLSIIRDTAGADQQRLKNFIFGQAATMSREDVFFLVIILAIVLIIIILFYRHFKLSIFNPEFYQSLGFSNAFMRFLMNVLTILVVVAGINAVGVILMSALLIAPGVAARLWSNKLSVNLLLASIFGISSSILGTLLGTSVPTGPVIVIFSSIIVITSLMFAPKQGYIWKLITNRMYSNKIKTYQSLIHLYETGNSDTISSESLHLYLKESLINFKDDKYLVTKKGIIKVESIIRGKVR